MCVHTRILCSAQSSFWPLPYCFEIESLTMLALSARQGQPTHKFWVDGHALLCLTFHVSDSKPNSGHMLEKQIFLSPEPCSQSLIKHLSLQYLWYFAPRKNLIVEKYLLLQLLILQYLSIQADLLELGSFFLPLNIQGYEFDYQPALGSFFLKSSMLKWVCLWVLFSHRAAVDCHNWPKPNWILLTVTLS